jgi:hypothetical protein
MKLLEPAADFGIKESRGTLLRVFFSQQDIADLVGALRPRVTEHMAQCERENLIIRQGRQLIVPVDKIENATNLSSFSTADGAFIKDNSHVYSLRGEQSLWRQ